jgi:hypothetical protein
MRVSPDQTSDFTCDLIGTAPDAAQVAELTTDVQVIYGGKLLYIGRVGACQDTVDSGGHVLSAAATDYRGVLGRRAIASDVPGGTLSPSGVDQALIVWNLIAYTQGRAGGQLGIAKGVGQSTGKTRTMTFTLGDYIADDITTVAQLDGGFDWQVTPYGRADLRLDIFTPVQGTDNGVVFTPGDGRVVSIVRTTDPSTFGNAIFETGQAPPSGSKPSVASVEQINPGEQRFDKVIGSNITLTAALADDATAQLARAQVLVPAYVITLKPGSWGGPSDVWMGDLVTVVINSGRLTVNDQLRVMELAFTIDANGQETLALTVGIKLLDYNKQLPKILRRLRYLETR